MAGGGIETISNLRASWDKFELMMESHQLMIKEQVIWDETHSLLAHLLSFPSFAETDFDSNPSGIVSHWYPESANSNAGKAV